MQYAERDLDYVPKVFYLEDEKVNMAKDNKREQILNALESLLPGRRFHEITLDEVARSAGVGKGTIYLYFRDKDSLFAELVCFRLENLAADIAGLKGASMDTLPEQVFELVATFIKHHRSWFGAIGEFASHLAQMTGEQYEKIKVQGLAVLNNLAGIMQDCMPQWSAENAEFHARTLLWLIDGYARTDEYASENVLPPESELLAFFRRGAGLD